MQKWTIVKENDIKNKAKNISVVFEGQKMQNKYNSIYRGRNSSLSLFDKQTGSPFTPPTIWRQ